MLDVAPEPQRNRHSRRGTPVLRAGPEALIDLRCQVSLRVLFKNLIVSAGDLACTQSRSITTR